MKSLAIRAEPARCAEQHLNWLVALGAAVERTRHHTTKTYHEAARGTQALAETGALLSTLRASTTCFSGPNCSKAYVTG